LTFPDLPLTQGREVNHSTLKVGFLAVLKGGTVGYDVQRVHGALLYRTKNELEATKLQPFKVNGLFLQKILDRTTHNLFSNLSKNP
jgi:hypothetical protein